MFGICNLSIVPCRKEPSDKSEMATQLLFGEYFEILEEKKSWALIRIAYDGYECWIDKKQFLPLKDLKGIHDFNSAITTDLVQLVSTKDNTQQHIPVILGSSLPKYKHKEFSLGKNKYFFEGDVNFPFKKNKKIVSSGAGLIETAKWYLNAPYLWGGRSPFGIDCSGFTQMVFKLNGIKLKRDAWQQAEEGKPLSFLEETQTGDLAFFDNEEGKIVHVGIVLHSQIKSSSNFQIIHASGKVHIDNLDHHGIYNEEMKKYSHRLRVIKRYV